MVDMFGIEYADNNELSGLCEDNESALVLCEGCGFIEVNSDGLRIDEL